jgi:hypothetical protein
MMHTAHPLPPTLSCTPFAPTSTLFATDAFVGMTHTPPPPLPPHRCNPGSLLLYPPPSLHPSHPHCPPPFPPTPEVIRARTSTSTPPPASAICTSWAARPSTGLTSLLTAPGQRRAARGARAAGWRRRGCGGPVHLQGTRQRRRGGDGLAAWAAGAGLVGVGPPVLACSHPSRGTRAPAHHLGPDPPPLPPPPPPPFAQRTTQRARARWAGWPSPPSPWCARLLEPLSRLHGGGRHPVGRRPRRRACCRVLGARLAARARGFVL